MASINPLDFTNLFNTQLTPEEEQAFLEWQKANPRLGNTYDYDARGFWKAGAKTSANGHGDDEFKKPNHPTFSVYSRYNGQGGLVGGRWVPGSDGQIRYFMAGPANVSLHGQDGLREYWRQGNDPDIELVFPAPGR